MFPNDYALLVAGNARAKELIAEAKRDRMVRAAKPQRATWKGDALRTLLRIRLGTARLPKRAPAPSGVAAE